MMQRKSTAGREKSRVNGLQVGLNLLYWSQVGWSGGKGGLKGGRLRSG